MNTTDRPKVIAATVSHDSDNAVLRMTTVDRVEIQFDLDDIAMSLLALTIGPTLQTIKSRVKPSDGDAKPVLFKRESE